MKSVAVQGFHTHFSLLPGAAAAMTSLFTSVLHRKGGRREDRFGGSRERAEGPRADGGSKDDDQDRLLAYGAFEYAFNEKGDLTSKIDTSTDEETLYEYDARGALLFVVLPDGTDIEYVIDGQGRRIGKKVDGTLVQGFLYKDQLRIAAELNGTGAVVARFVYVDDNHSPEYMIKGGAVYRFIKDQLGSPRVVINALTGAIAQQLEYDEFGNVLSDTAPGFQPFGFAAGLYDRDTGLVRFGARDYDAVTGRWTAKDPITWAGGQTNLYVYVGNDPVGELHAGLLAGLRCGPGIAPV